MAAITLDGVSKEYTSGERAVDNVSLEIADGEFMVLVGPSGCGKSTLLRMIAGLEEVTSGGVFIGERDATYDPPKDRDLAMVFQSYALYPHMSVRRNLGFGLKLRKHSTAHVAERVAWIAEILGLTDLLDRKPAQLSGGQRQRVAMGRAMVREPEAFLMDEPLSNLDAKLRVSMRAELAKLHDQLGTTTVYVTHDQVEAMTLGSRVAVLREGVLQQCSTPQEAYRSPVNLFCAAFIGSPTINLASAVAADGRVHFAGFDVAAELIPAATASARPIVIGIRPTDLSLSAAAPAHLPRITVEVDLVEDLGAVRHAVFSVQGTRISAGDTAAVGSSSDNPGIDMVEEGRLLVHNRTMFVAALDDRVHIVPGDRIELAIDVERIHAFDAQTGERISS